MPDEASAFTVLLGWDVAFSHEVSSQQIRQHLGVYFVRLDAGFSYCLCPRRIRQFDLNAFVFQFVIDLEPVVG